MKTIGVIGGMGPYATIDIFKKIVDMTPAKKDWEHLHIIIDNNTQIPSRGRYFAYNEKSPAPAMIKTAQNLERAGADFLIIGCNTAHYFYEDVAKNVKIPVLDMIKETVKEVFRRFPEIKKIGLLGSEATCTMEIYNKEFDKNGVEVIYPNELSKLREIIDGIKTGRNMKSELIKISDTLIEKGAQGIILGCTEFGINLKDGDLKVPVFDSTLILAKKAVEKAKEK